MFVIYDPLDERKPWRDTTGWRTSLKNAKPYKTLARAKAQAAGWFNVRVLTVEEAACLDLLRKM